ncbi:GIY-YIG nuclease family protein [Candidatus Wolfebacteria bacterium]|nr:GIY-YIG nuclease family protein [Candidatus Wolfebacteria bacterium]
MPSTTISISRFYYVYVLESLKDKKRYVGYTTNLPERIKAHKKGLSFATKFRLPIKLIYFEGCTNIRDAKRREKYFKKSGGRKFLSKRLIEYYQSKL